jgi:hypothetical protein
MEKMKFNPELVYKGKCVNGDDNPVCPPSAVLCQDCMDAISVALARILERMEKCEKE